MHIAKSVTVFMIVSTLSVIGCASSPSSKSGTGQNKSLSKKEKAAYYVEMGNNSLLSNDPIGALQNFTEAEKLGERSVHLYHGFALAYFLREDRKRAIEYARQAVKTEPTSSMAQNTLGKLLLDQRKYQEAETHLRKAAEDPLFRDAFKARTSLGILHYRLGNFRKAESHLTTAINEGRSNACVARYYLGHLRLKAGEFKEAAKEYDLATRQICASFADAHFAKGVALERDHQYEAARKKFLEVSRNFPATNVAEKSIEKLQRIP